MPGPFFPPVGRWGWGWGWGKLGGHFHSRTCDLSEPPLVCDLGCCLPLTAQNHHPSRSSAPPVLSLLKSPALHRYVRSQEQKNKTNNSCTHTPTSLEVLLIFCCAPVEAVEGWVGVSRVGSKRQGNAAGKVRFTDCTAGFEKRKVITESGDFESVEASDAQYPFILVTSVMFVSGISRRCFLRGIICPVIPLFF